MSKDGWIKIYRRITDHWIYKNSDYVYAWITILMTVNYEPKPTIIHGEKFDCGRGQSLLSLQSWTRLFGRNWTVQKTRTFFDLLKEDSMINTEGLHKTTRLTVCKYDDYQDMQQADNTQNNEQNKQQAKNTQKVENLTCQTIEESTVCSVEQQAKNTQKVENLTTTKEVKKIRSKKGKKKEADFLTKIITAFQEVYFDSNQIEYTITAMGKERAAAAKLLNIYKGKYPEANSEETIQILQEYFKKCCTINDDWLQTKMSLSLIVSKFTEINNTLKNTNNGKPKNRTVADRSGELDQIISAVFAASGIA